MKPSNISNLSGEWRTWEFNLVRVCVAEAESMATALSRSPLYVRGGHLHAFEKLFALTLYIDWKILYGLSAVLWRSAREV